MTNTQPTTLKEEIEELNAIASQCLSEDFESDDYGEVDAFHQGWERGEIITSKKALKIIIKLQKFIKIQDKAFERMARYSANAVAPKTIRAEVREKSKQILGE